MRLRYLLTAVTAAILAVLVNGVAAPVIGGYAQGMEVVYERGQSVYDLADDEATPAEDGELSGEEYIKAYLETFRRVSENNAYALYVIPENGEFYVLDKASKKRWFSNPAMMRTDELASGINRTNANSQLVLTYVNAKKSEEMTNTYVGSVRKDGVTVEDIKNGFKATYRFADEGFTIPVYVTVDTEGLDIRIPVEEIREEKENRLYNLKLYPNLGAGGLEDDGYMLVPDGSGAIIRYNNGKEAFAAYRKSVYGNDEATPIHVQSDYSPLISLPVYGAKVNDDAYCAVIMEGEEYASINAAVSGQAGSYNLVYPDFQLRYSYRFSLDGTNDVFLYDREPLAMDALAIRYQFISGDGADYNGMAREARRLLFGEDVSSSIGGNPLFIDLYGGTKEKGYFLFVPIWKDVKLTTFEQAGELLADMQGEGVDRFIVRYRNSTDDYLEGKVAKNIDLLSGVGGKKGFARLTEQFSETAVFAPVVNLSRFKKNGNGVSAMSSAVRDPSGVVSKSYPFRLSTLYEITDAEPYLYVAPGKLRQVGDKFLKSEPGSLSGAIDLTDLVGQLYSNFDNNRTGMNAAKDAMRYVLEACGKEFTSITASNPFWYALTHVDYAFDVPAWSGGHILADGSVPFYQLVVGGAVDYAVPSINLEANQRLVLLKALESGSRLQISLIANDEVDLIDTKENQLFGVQYSAVKQSLAAMYSELDAVYRETAYTRLVAHEILENGVTRSTFENGVSVLVNCTEKDVAVGGDTVKAMGYQTVKAGGGQ